MGTIISFNAHKKGSLGNIFGAAAPVTSPVNNGPSPNFDDPHSADFGAEPAYDKTLCDFLSFQDQQDLIRFQHQRNLYVKIEEDRTITLSKKADFSDVSDNSIRSLFSHKPTLLPIAIINCPDPADTRQTFSYMLADSGETVKVHGFKNLLNTMARHMSTGSPELPEPEIWR